MTKRIILVLTPLALAAHSAQGIIQVDYDVLNDGSIYSVSDSDLLQTSLDTISSTGEFNIYFPDSDWSLLVDGTFGAANTDYESSAAPAVATVTFALDLETSPMGYDISRIDTYAGWDWGRDGQVYSVYYSSVAEPTSFNLLQTTAYYNPGITNPANAHTRLSIFDTDTGILAENVAALRFEFDLRENGGTAYREIDVIGVTAVPEAEQYAAGLGLVALLWAYRRRRR